MIVCFVRVLCVCYRIKCEIGSGHFGSVSKGEWLLRGEGGEVIEGEGVQVAVKVVKTEAEEMQRVKLLQEAAIMGQFSHPNVVRLNGVVTVGDPVSGTWTAISLSVVINPRRACAARVTVLGLSFRPSVCLSVCLFPRFLPLRATRRPKSDTNGFSTTLA